MTVVCSLETLCEGDSFFESSLGVGIVIAE